MTAGDDRSEPELVVLERVPTRLSVDVDSVAVTVTELLDRGVMIVDLSHHDHRADVIELRVSHTGDGTAR
jgi:hypothetical protein